MSRDLELGLFPQEVIDAYNKELDAADEADEIAAKVVVNLDYDWESDEKTPTVQNESMYEIMETLRSPGIPTATSDKPTRPIRPIALRKLATNK